MLAKIKISIIQILSDVGISKSQYNSVRKATNPLQLIAKKIKPNYIGRLAKMLDLSEEVIHNAHYGQNDVEINTSNYQISDIAKFAIITADKNDITFREVFSKCRQSGMDKWKLIQLVNAYRNPLTTSSAKLFDKAYKTAKASN